jgi:hypothetical protein
MPPRGSCTRSCSGWATLTSAGQPRECWRRWLAQHRHATADCMTCGRSLAAPSLHPCKRFLRQLVTQTPRCAVLWCPRAHASAAEQVRAVAVSRAGLLPHQARDPPRHQAREPAGALMRRRSGCVTC